MIVTHFTISPQFLIKSNIKIKDPFDVDKENLM